MGTVQMPVKVSRRPFESDGCSLPQIFDASVVVAGLGSTRQVEIRFTTNPGGLRKNSFSALIGAADFEELASAMMQADARAAIKAFGAALQDVPEIA
jgi:hypothetical protein